MAGQTASDSLTLATSRTPFHEEGTTMAAGKILELMENHSGCSNRLSTMTQICTSGPLYLNPALSSIFLSSTTSSSDSPYDGIRSSLPPPKKTFPLVESPPSSPSLPPADAAQVVYVMEERCVPLEEMEVEELSNEPRKDSLLPGSNSEATASPSRPSASLPPSSEEYEPDAENTTSLGDTNQHSTATIGGEVERNLDISNEATNSSDLLGSSLMTSAAVEPTGTGSVGVPGLEEAAVSKDGSGAEVESDCDTCSTYGGLVIDTSPQDPAVLDAPLEGSDNETVDKKDERFHESETSEEAEAYKETMSEKQQVFLSDTSAVLAEESEQESSKEHEETTSNGREAPVDDLDNTFVDKDSEMNEDHVNETEKCSEGSSLEEEQSDISNGAVLELADEEQDNSEKQSTVEDDSETEQGETVDSREGLVEDSEVGMDVQEESSIKEALIEEDREVAMLDESVKGDRPVLEDGSAEDTTDQESCYSLKSDNSIVNSDDQSSGDRPSPQPDTVQSFRRVQSRRSAEKRGYNLRKRSGFDYNEAQLGYCFIKPMKRSRNSTEKDEKVTTPDSSPCQYNSVVREDIRCSKLEIPIKKLPSPFTSPKVPTKFRSMRLVLKKTPSPTSRQPLVPSPIHAIPSDQITPSWQSPQLTTSVLSQSFYPYTLPGSTSANKSTQTQTTPQRSSSSSKTTGTNQQTVGDSAKPPSTPSKSRSPRRRRSGRLSDEQSADKQAKNTCILCGLPSNIRSLGYLYGPYPCSIPASPRGSVSSSDGKEHKQEVRVHVSCAIWAPGVCLGAGEGELRGLQTVVDECAKQYCVVCDRPGATLTCHQHGCKAVYHYPCARDNNIQFIRDQFCIYCVRHNKKEEEEGHT